MTNTVTETKKPCGHCGKGTPAAAYGSVPLARIQKARVERPQIADGRRQQDVSGASLPTSYSLLSTTRIYAAACKDSRIEKLPAQLAKLQLPYTLERELPTMKTGTVSFDSASRRFKAQVTNSITKPLLWLEDDIDIPDDFIATWKRYENTLPPDWKVAVLGWGLVFDNEDIKIRRVLDSWWHLEGGTKNYAAFAGAQAVLVNSGEWRNQLADKEFCCDVGLCGVLRQIGVTEIYHTDRVLIGTNDPVTTFGDAVVQYTPMSAPRYFGWKTGYRPINEDDFIDSSSVKPCDGCGGDGQSNYVTGFKNGVPVIDV